MADLAVQRKTLRQIIGLINLMRPKQWIKNSFVLAPLVFSGQFLNAASVNNALFATLLFCVGSSAVYVLNDMADIERDRSHPKKSRSRPLASGIVTVPTAVGLLTALYAILVWASFFALQTVLVIAGYLLLNVAYTLVLKHQPVLDIFSIAIGFVLRVYAGAAALSVPVSGWMAVTTLCLALYLAAIKRRQELIHSGSNGRKVLQQYSITLTNQYAQISAIGALLFYSLYVVTANPHMIITVPLVLFGLFRYWFDIESLDGGEAPTEALLADRQLLATVLIWAGICVWALWPVG